jgi:hypothetical protein
MPALGCKTRSGLRPDGRVPARGAQRRAADTSGNAVRREESGRENPVWIRLRPERWTRRPPMTMNERVAYEMGVDESSRQALP